MEVALCPTTPRKKMTKQLTGKRDDTELHSAARAGNIIAIRAAINGAGEEELMEVLTKQNSAGETPLYVAAEYGYYEVVREMIHHYDMAAAGIKARNGFDALHIAAKQGDLEVVKVLMEAYPELSMTVDMVNTTVLHTAAAQGRIEVVSYFLDAESSLAAIARSNGKTALHSAARNGHVEVVKALLSKERGMTARTDKKGQTALHMAVKGQNLEVVEELIRADPLTINMVDTKGNTPLHIAARKGRAQNVEALLSHKEIDTRVVNRSNETAIDTAEKMGNSDTAAILRGHGVLSARAISPQSTNPVRELKQTVSDIKHEVHNQLEHTRQTRKRVQGIAKRINKMHAEGLNNAINSTTVVAVLIATVAFAAIFTIPGQYVDNPQSIPEGQVLGEAHIAPKLPFLIFFIFDSTALFISLAVVVVQTSIVVIESKAKKQMMAIINKLMWLACVLVSVAYLALSFVVVGNREKWLAIGVTIIGTSILVTTLSIMCYWVVMHRIESNNVRVGRENSLGSRSRSGLALIPSETEALNSEFKKIHYSVVISLVTPPIAHPATAVADAMDEELLELQRQFEFAQQAKSSIRLSERNVVELVQKLQQLQIIDFDLLHTTSGKEYITPEQLRSEIVSEINKRGRVSLIDLADTTGVDLYHVEKQSQHVVSDDSSLMLINGEIISNSYWDTVSEEINERLQECSQISLAEIAAQLQVGSELLVSVLEPRLGTLVKGRLEGGQLYTPAYVARVSAMVRGAARGIAVPMNLSALWSSLQVLLQDMDGFSGVAVESSFFQSLFNGLVKGGEILGSVRAGVHWTPSVFAVAQRECVDSFFSQNSFISYDALHKLGIPQPIQFLQSRYPEGKPLATIFTHGSLIAMLDASMEDVIERGSWIDSLTILPASFTPQDASKILSLCPSVQKALKSSKAQLLGESYVFSDALVKHLFENIEKELENLNVSGFNTAGLSEGSHTTKNATHGHDDSSPADPDKYDNQSGISKSASEKGSKKKKGKATGNAKAGSAESVPESQEPTGTKSKKKMKKGKVIPAAQASDSKSGGKRDNERMDDPGFLSEESLIQKIMSLIPDLEEQGMDDPDTVLAPLANHLRPMLLNSWMERRKAAFTENAQKMKRVFDNLQRKLDEGFLNIQLYEKALDLFEDDQSTAVLLHKHLLRTAATPIVDALLVNLDIHNKLRNGIQVEESQNPESASMSSADRISLAKGMPGPLSVKAVGLVETLEGKRVESFMSAVREFAEESGLMLKKLDKKLERTLLHSYRKDLTSQVSAETDPVSLLPKVVSLLYVQVHGKALQAPGRAISVAIAKLKDKLDDTAFKTLADYQSAAVTLLSLISAGTGNEEDCTSDRILSKRELLEGSIPALKSLVLGSSSQT
ncbi:E3 UFM1-protein ligase 1 [Sesamum alatum]|uniref:E3 UFM1-protein ligase 1 n=1 Tax=Sesamum alatum TaxID=300844 RepID=A0AAE1Z278_9LAMI|nr:E3 UFM1-protein ligase 1 [Sesamum alatum]